MEEIYADLLHATLCHIWTRKLAFLRRSTGFKTIKIVAGDREVVIDNRDARSMENGNGKDDFRRRRLRDMAQIVGHATVIVRRELEGRIRRGGWRELRDWVDGGGFRAGV